MSQGMQGRYATKTQKLSYAFKDKKIYIQQTDNPNAAGTEQLMKRHYATIVDNVKDSDIVILKRPPTIPSHGQYTYYLPPDLKKKDTTPSGGGFEDIMWQLGKLLVQGDTRTRLVFFSEWVTYCIGERRETCATDEQAVERHGVSFNIIPDFLNFPTRPAGAILRPSSADRLPGHLIPNTPLKIHLYAGTGGQWKGWEGYIIKAGGELVSWDHAQITVFDVQHQGQLGRGFNSASFRGSLVVWAYLMDCLAQGRVLDPTPYRLPPAPPRRY